MTTTRTPTQTIITRRPTKGQMGHSIVKTVTQDVEGGIRYASPRRVTLVCECGKVFRTKGGGTSAVLYRHASHVAKELTGATR